MVKNGLIVVDSVSTIIKRYDNYEEYEKMQEKQMDEEKTRQHFQEKRDLEREQARKQEEEEVGEKEKKLRAMADEAGFEGPYDEFEEQLEDEKKAQLKAL